jgi:uncharacterized protein (DUF934 family)
MTLLDLRGAAPQVVEVDRWTVVGADDALPADGVDVVVPLARLLAQAEALSARSGALGVSVAPDEDVTTLAPHVGRVSAVFLHFKKFADGRGYSQARLLRIRLGYAGELRATGDVLRDQALYLSRCGFDVLALRADQSVEGVLASMGAFTLAYQPAEGALPVVTLK